MKNIITNKILKTSTWLGMYCVLLGQSVVFADEQEAIQQIKITKASIVPSSPIQAEKFHLNNGLTVVFVPDDRNTSASVHFILDAGSNREVKGETGLAHFFEHMMFRKTKNMPEGNFDRVLNAVGGSGNAMTSDSFVTFYENFPAPALETILKLDADRFQNLDISEPFFSIEKNAVISERKMRVENDPFSRAEEQFRLITERGTPLEWMTIGYKNDIEKMTLQSARNFYKNFYTPDNTIMIVGGPFSTSYVTSLVSKYFSTWSGKLDKNHYKYDENYFVRDLGKSFLCQEAVLNQKFAMIYPRPKADFNDYMFSRLFSVMLDESDEGTFSRRLLKQNLAYSFLFYSSFWEMQKAPLEVHFELKSDQNFENVKKFWLQNIQRVLHQPITNKIRQKLLKDIQTGNADIADRLSSLVETELDYNYFFREFTLSGKDEKWVSKVSDSKFRTWVEKNLSGENFYVTGVTPLQNNKAIPDCSSLSNNIQR